MSFVHARVIRAAMLLGAFTLSACTTTPTQVPVLETDAIETLDRNTFGALLHGDFNNYLQTWQQKQDEVDVPFPNEHIMMQVVTDEASLADATLATRAIVGQPETTQRRWYTWNATKGEAWVLNAGAQPPVTRGKLTRDPACDMTWRAAASGYEVSSIGRDCALLQDISAIRLDREGMVVTVDGDTLAFKRVRQFTGWMGVKKQRWDPEAGDDDWVFMAKFGIHNEGEAVRLVDKDGTPTGYAVKLERLVYQNTRTPVLKLGLIDESTKKTITYIWSEPGSRRLGMNLRWFQVGLTAVAE